MRWLKKREVVIYFLLQKKFGTNEFNVGEALEYLSPYFSKKVSLNVIRYFYNTGILIKTGELRYKLIPWDEYMLDVSFKYLRRRATLHHKIRS
ncbi:hypothetical protein [Stygiolobus caldivivus]|uniref:Uncharacterized protein n=1 Tax=Stygiolobus caldivivus TaxID=2824673 RepID=A0A8D5U8S2_9CREN|nr:hypothetical protein [Stygiolobus caldivivus]BCU71135.1 hypothetical protein KN1_24320 [Stygiolobus caldivivus]